VTKYFVPAASPRSKFVLVTFCCTQPVVIAASRQAVARYSCPAGALGEGLYTTCICPGVGNTDKTTALGAASVTTGSGFTEIGTGGPGSGGPPPSDSDTVRC